MTCKDCYHYKVCSKNDKTTDYYGKEIACGNVDDVCKYFKDKSRIIELPCKVTSKFKERLTEYCEETSIRHNLYERHVDEL